MKPLGAWRNSRSKPGYGYFMDVGPIHAVVYLEDGYGEKEVEGWYYEVYGLFEGQEPYKTADDAKLSAEETLTRLIGEAVREGSRLGLYGKKRVVREIRKATRVRKE